MKALWIARNIPSPAQQRNAIILDLAERLGRAGLQIDVVHPVEAVPRLPYRDARLRALVRLGRWYDWGGRRIAVARYLRLPSERASYLLVGSLLTFQPELARAMGCADLVHCHHVLPDGYVGLEAKRRWGVPFIVTARQGDLLKMRRLGGRGVQWRMYCRVLRSANAVIAHNGRVRDELAKLGVEARMIPHGIEPTCVETSSGTRGGGSQAVRVLVVARLVRGKNVDWVVRAVAEYRGSREIELRVVGDGELRGTLEGVASSSGRVHFLGHLPPAEVAEQYRMSDIFALPCQDETFGVVFLEAAARGNAMVALRGEGIWDWFQEGTEISYATGYEDFARRLYDLVEVDERRDEMGDSARRRVLRDFVWDRVTEQYLGLYRDVLARGEELA